MVATVLPCLAPRAKQRSLEFEQLQSQARGRRDVPPYPKYILTEETIRYLKMPTFDIWHWEPNEMLSLVEHMYGEFGLVTALHINPITLKRWLVSYVTSPKCHVTKVLPLPPPSSYQRAVQDNYHDNPFHNFRHCFCVTQMVSSHDQPRSHPRHITALEVRRLKLGVNVWERGYRSQTHAHTLCS